MYEIKKRNQKGFTLAELLIVVAIIAVLVAIAIPIFNAQLEKSRQATNLANARSSVSEYVATQLQNAADVTKDGVETAANSGATKAGTGGSATCSDTGVVTVTTGDLSDTFKVDLE